MRNVLTHPRRVVASAVFFAVTVSSAHAGEIIGGSSILDPTNLNQLEVWLGEGPLSVTNVFTKDTTDSNKNDSVDWHAAVDGKGRTFSLWEVMTSNGVGGLDSFVFGGYNPQSWSSHGYNVTNNDADRTAFIFNLTTNTRLDQCKTTDNSDCGNNYSNNYTGRYQTFNRAHYGPVFGGGFDLQVNFNLSAGYNYSYSYGNPAGDAGYGRTSSMENDDSSYRWHSVGALETFSIAPYTGTVPEPSILALFGLGLAGLGFSKRTKGRRAALS